jgi:hypothetical protein
LRVVRIHGHVWPSMFRGKQARKIRRHLMMKFEENEKDM